MLALLLKCVFLGLLATETNGGRRGDEESKPPKVTESLLYDPLAPIVKTEFSVMLLPRDTDCYYHYVPKYAVMQFQFRVTTPPGTMARGVVSIIISSPSQERIFRAHFKKADEMPDTVANESGYYEICLYNSLERFGEKKIRIMFSYLNEASMEIKKKEDNETDVIADDMQIRANKLMLRTNQMNRHLFFLKVSEGGHYECMVSMMQYIKTASIVTCSAIIVVAYLQTFVLKRFFNDPAKNYPRA